MPNNDDNDRNSGPVRGPWGDRGNRRPEREEDNEDLESMLRKARDRFNGQPPRGRTPGSLPPFGRGSGVMILGIALIGWLATGVFFVDAGEQAVVTRFGKYVRTELAGAHVTLPYPIESYVKRPTEESRRTEVGTSESLMLTGDENMVNLTFQVLWKINNIENFVFNVKDPEIALVSVAESVMRETVGKRRYDAVTTTERGAIETEVQTKLQTILDSYKAGILIEEVNLQTSAPPKPVEAAFRSVAAAGQDAAAAEQTALAYQAKVVQEAKGDAARLLSEGRAYKESVVAEAQGEVARFLAVLPEYKRAPGVTRRRLYLETMEKIMARTDKTIIDGKNVTPYVPVDGLKRRPAIVPYAADPNAASPSVTPKQEGQN